MPTTYMTPGVYVEEVDRGSKPIEAVGASKAAFVGITAQASRKFPDTGTPNLDPERMIKVGQAVEISSWTQYQQIFGGFAEGIYLPEAVYGYFNNGGGPCYVTSLYALEESGETAAVVIPAAGGEADDELLDSSTEASESNSEGTAAKKSRATRSKTASGQPSFRVVARAAGSYGNRIKVHIEPEAEDNRFTMIVTAETTLGEAREEQSGLSLRKDDARFVGQDNLFRMVRIENEGKALPMAGTYALQGGGTDELPEWTAADFIGSVATRTGLGGLEEKEDIRLVLCPDLMAVFLRAETAAARENAKTLVRAVQNEMVAMCERLRNRFAILDTPPGLSVEEAREWRDALGVASSYAALYYPWIKVLDWKSGGLRTRAIPPSGHVAGVYNRVDEQVGFHKAPANEVVFGAIDLEQNLTKAEQGGLNQKGINCIRALPGQGIRVWGARTLSPDPSWRYINVRRLFIVVGASLDANLNWVVFQPNDATLWAKVRRDVNAFLRTLWLSGALFGKSPAEAYYVKCDEELNPKEIRDLGQLIIEIGLAPITPAEFVIFRLSQWAGPNAAG